MKDDNEMFRGLLEGANAVHPDRLEALRRVRARQAKPRLLPAAAIGALTVVLVVAAVALLALQPAPGPGAGPGSSPEGAMSARLTPLEESRLQAGDPGGWAASVDCEASPVPVTVVNLKDTPVTLESVEVFGIRQTITPGGGMASVPVNAVVPARSKYTYRLDRELLGADPSRRTVGAHSVDGSGAIVESAYVDCPAGPHPDIAAVLDGQPTAVGEGYTPLAPQPGAETTMGRDGDGEVGADPNSPLGLPRSYLEGYVLENEREGLSDASSPSYRLVKKHRGRQLLHNEWVHEAIHQAGVSGGDRFRLPRGRYFVSEGHYEFRTVRTAEVFLSESMEVLAREDSWEDGPDRSPSGSEPGLSDGALVYEGRFPSLVKGSSENHRGYAVAFRTGTVVSRLVVLGDETLTREHALELARAAQGRVKRALENGR